MERGAFRCDVLLLIAAAIWGSGFVAQRCGMDHVGPMTFNAIRFAIGACVLIPLACLRGRRSEAVGGKRAPCVSLAAYAVGGGIAGLVLTVAASLQQVGIVYTSAGKAGFITGLYVVFVPMIGLAVGASAHWGTWAGAIVSVVGLSLLSLTESFEANPGDLYVLACAVFWAIHVLVIGRVAPAMDPLKLAIVQFSVVAILAALIAWAYEPIRWADLCAARWAVLYSGLFSVGIAFTLQVVAQRGAPPAHAAILLSLEAVFAALSGYVILGETLSPRQLAGCLLMLAGMLVSQFCVGSRTTT